MSKTWTDERRALARQKYEAGASLLEIAAELKSSGARVAAAIRKAGGTVRRRGARQEKNYFWTGGRIVDKQGYVLLKVDHPHANASGYVREHRLVMEQVLGRLLLPEEVVHHKNGVNSDNRPENLEVFPSNASHLAHELKGKCLNWTPEGRARLAARTQRQKDLAAARRALKQSST
jgi:hypothetical protein